MKILVLLTVLSSALAFQLTLNYPFLLTPTREKINDIAANGENKVLVAFDNTFIRVYSPNFSSYVDWSVPEPVESIRFGRITGDCYLSNGTVLRFYKSLLSYRSNKLRTFRIMNYSTYQLKLSLFLT